MNSNEVSYTFSPKSSPRPVTTSTPQSNYRPRVNFHSIESLVNSSSTSISSPSFSVKRNDDTGYHSMQSPSVVQINTTGHRKPRRKLSDWQTWYLCEVYAKNRYPSPIEQEHIASQLLLPNSSIRIWFQNHRARQGKN